MKMLKTRIWVTSDVAYEPGLMNGKTSKPSASTRYAT